MTDRQLLEDAARAAGMDGWYYSEIGPRGPGMYRAANGVLSWCNPLVDDGDALRLAVKLRIDVVWSRPYDYVCATNTSTQGASLCEALEGDENAATRRAIVRAAAEIGKGMAHD